MKNNKTYIKVYKETTKGKNNKQIATNDCVTHDFPKENFSYTHDKEAKVFYLNLNTKVKQRKAVLDKAEAILDVDAAGNIVGIEILYK